MAAGQEGAMEHRIACEAITEGLASNPLQRRDPATVYAVRCMVMGILSEGRTTDKVIEVADTARLWALYLIHHTPPAPRPVACKAGCPWCCYLPVGITAAEAIRIAEYLHATLPREKIGAMQEEIAELDEHTRHMDEDTRALARLPCAFLNHRMCSVYPVRPLACIAWNSCDAEACNAAWYTSTPGTVPTHTLCYQAAMSVRRGLREGLIDAGLDGRKLDLTTALRVALETPDSTNRWLAGEPVFAPACWELKKTRLTVN